MSEVTYNGVYQPPGVESRCPAPTRPRSTSASRCAAVYVRRRSTISAALLFAAADHGAPGPHFTGAFRRPREANWVIGSLLLILAMFEGYFGYSLPDDLLSGIGLRAALSSITLGLPIIGTWMHWALFGGDFPCGGVGNQCDVVGIFRAPDVRAAHPADPRIILALIGVHLALVWFQKHTQFPGSRTHRRRTSSACASCRSSRSSPVASSRWWWASWA